MNKYFSRSALTIAVVSALTACGGGGGGSSDNSAPPAATPATSIGGSATKGILVNAPVKVYEVLSGGALSTAPVASATTDSFGTYTATFNSAYKGGPLKIVISGGSGATMVCDIPNGCGSGVAFGQTMPLDSTFSLSAAVPAPTGTTVSVHVTPITDIAEKLAEKNGLSSTTIGNANDVIRQAFSLGKDITSIKPVDITKADSVTAGDSDAKQIALLSAAILTAVAQQSGSTLESGLAQFVNSVANGGGLVVNDTGSNAEIISLKDILVAAETVSTAAKQKAQDEDKAIDLGSSDSVVALLLTDVESKTPSDTPNTSIQPIDTLTKDNVAKARALASDLRTIATSAALKSGAAAFESQIQQAFGDQLDMVSVIATSDLGVITTRTAQAVEAIGAAELAYLNDPTLTVFVQPAVINVHPDISVAIATGTDATSNVTFTVNQTIGESAVNLTSVDSLQVTGDEAELEITDAGITLTGSVTSSKLKLTITQGRAQLGSLHSVDPLLDAGYNSIVTFSNAGLNLDASITQVDTSVVNPVTFTGSFSATVDTGRTTATSTFTQTGDYNLETAQETWTFSNLTTGLNGQFSDTQQHSVSANFSATLSNPNGVVSTVTDTETLQFCCDGFSYIDDNITSSNETPTKYLGVQFTAGLSAQLPGVSSAASIVVDGHRTSYLTGLVNATIRFNGKVITISANNTSQQLTISNQDGVTITASKPSASVAWSGILKIGSAEVATLETTNSGITILRYRDGTFESLM